VVTGDMTQIDLPKHQKSGLKDAVEVLHGVEGVSFTFFESRDVVRHPLVARIVNAYESRDARGAQTGDSGPQGDSSARLRTDQD
jgi:phosphate starvation-inducible PhoH-like protein